MQLAQRAHAAERDVMVDDAVLVHHHAGSGYDHGEARAQMRAWLHTLPWHVRAAHALLLVPRVHGDLGCALVRHLPWSLLRAGKGA